MNRERPKNIVNIADVEPHDLEVGNRFAYTRRALGRAARSVEIGASHIRVPPQKAAWPAHYHVGNEEAIFILEGQGRLRLEDDHYPVRPGDWIALPVGPVAHQLHNDGPGDLVYLCISTMHKTDICVYPDSGKVGLFGGAAPGGDRSERSVAGYFRQADAVPYYDGEADDQEDA